MARCTKRTCLGLEDQAGRELKPCTMLICHEWHIFGCALMQQLDLAEGTDPAYLCCAQLHCLQGR